jgi:hypothetical protein
MSKRYHFSLFILQTVRCSLHAGAGGHHQIKISYCEFPQHGMLWKTKFWKLDAKE